jgi:RNA polymerase sigma-70 factor (ECF subfamily)
MVKKPFHTSARVDSSKDFEEAYVNYARRIYGYLFHRTRDVHLSEDLTSTVFEKAWRARKTFHGGSIKAWLYTITRHVLADHWRSKKAIAVDDIEEWPDETDSIEVRLDKAIELERLYRALNRLPDVMREVVKLRFIVGLSAKRTADILGITEGNVRIIQYRALRRIRDYINENLP